MIIKTIIGTVILSVSAEDQSQKVCINQNFGKCSVYLHNRFQNLAACLLKADILLQPVHYTLNFSFYYWILYSGRHYELIMERVFNPAYRKELLLCIQARISPT